MGTLLTRGGGTLGSDTNNTETSQAARVQRSLVNDRTRVAEFGCSPVVNLANSFSLEICGRAIAVEEWENSNQVAVVRRVRFLRLRYLRKTQVKTLDCLVESGSAVAVRVRLGVRVSSGLVYLNQCTEEEDVPDDILRDDDDNNLVLLPLLSEAPLWVGQASRPLIVKPGRKLGASMTSPSLHPLRISAVEAQVVNIV